MFTSSTAGLKGFGGVHGGGLGYAASKHGIVGLMRTLANALAPANIRVNTVHPTAVSTMMAINPAMTEFLENYPGADHICRTRCRSRCSSPKTSVPPSLSWSPTRPST